MEILPLPKVLLKKIANVNVLKNIRPVPSKSNVVKKIACVTLMVVYERIAKTM